MSLKNAEGYSLINYLPAMTGRVVGSTDISNRFLWDIRRTHADLMADNYYGRLHELCKQHGMKTYTQPYDRGPFEEMQIGSRVDAPMGEFWAGLSQLFANNDTMRRTIKLSSSIAHTNGQKLVLAEAFTAEPSSGKWQQYPFGMKALGDYMFTQGMNRLTFHRFAHQPHPTALPGMTMGPWGTHFDRTNTWFLKGAAWLKYTARCQALLQQGLFVADIAYLTSEDAPGFTPVRPHELEQTPPEGYDYDLMNAETVLKRVKIQNGRITLPDGMSYKIMILPAGNTMTLELLKQTHSLVNQGMILVGAKPLATPGLTSYKDKDKDAEFTRLTNELWGSTETTKTFGKGKIFTGIPVRQVLESLNIKPDFEFSAHTHDAPVNYIHKNINGADVYFIANRRRTNEDIVASFRVNDKRPEIWNPDTGEIIPVHFYEVVDGRIHIPLQLDHAGSLFVVFRTGAAPAKRITSVTANGTQIVNTAISRPSPVTYNIITHDFSVSLWIKPEIDIALGRKQLGSYAGRTTTEYYAIYPPSGEKLYGAGHAATGLTVGRNGIVLWEREGIDAMDVLVAEMPVSGWTHLAIVYKGERLLYMLMEVLLKKEVLQAKLFIQD
ncbi:MAG: glycosyl hydrolase [Segetibacter sp.]